MTKQIKKFDVEKDHELNHESAFKDYSMVPEIIFAIRFFNSGSWVIRAWECTYDELIDELGMVDIDFYSVFDFTILIEHEVIRGLNGYLLEDIAYSQRWLFDPENDRWMSMPDPSGDLWIPASSEVSVQENEVTPADIKLSLISIGAGVIHIKAQGAESNVSVQLSSSQDDLTDLIRFFNVLSSGAAPHLTFNGCGMNVIKTFRQLDNNIRLCISHVDPKGGGELIDIITSRNKLLSEVIDLVNSIANHPRLADEWFCRDEINGVDDKDVVSQLKSALSAIDLGFVGKAYKTKIRLCREKVFKQKLLDAASNNLINKETSDNQGKFFKLAIQQEGREGWTCFSSIKSPKSFLQACADDGLKVAASRVICEYRARPLRSDINCFDHKPLNYAKGWKRDRFHQCWRAPNEEIKIPAWSIPEEELQRREASLKVVVPTLTKWILKIYNQDKALIHSDEAPAVGLEDPAVEYEHFYWGIGEYAESQGLLHGPFTSVKAMLLEVSGEMLNYGEFHQSFKKSANEWQVERIEAPSRKIPLIKVNTIPLGLSDRNVWEEWGEKSTRYGAYYPFLDFPDLKLVETILEEEWLPRLNCAREIDDKGTLDLDWDDFHKQGLKLAFRLKAILGERADIVYEKSFQDPNYLVEQTRFVL